MDTATLAYKIAAARQQKGLSQQELGAMVGVSNKAVSKWEKGTARPRAGLIYRVAQALDLTVEDFLDTSSKTHSTLLPETKHAQGMASIRELYRIGQGPSSSHIMAPQRASQLFLVSYPNADRYEMTLYGSLAWSCKSYKTDAGLQEIFAPKDLTLIYDTVTHDLPHPNTFDLRAYEGEETVGAWRLYSTGGGAIVAEGDVLPPLPMRYAHATFHAISAYCQKAHLRLWEYVAQQEGDDIWLYLSEIWQTMKASVQKGLETTGTLPGDLGVERKASHLYHQHHPDESAETRENRLVCAYAFAVSEENAAGGIVATAPTCGACGVLPAVLLYAQQRKGYTDAQILHALATAGLIGNLIKTNASISGAECGCQAEIGSACSMASAALAELYEMDLGQIEYAAEIAIEHHLGLTCDPIHGLIQIPCIERNAVAAMRAINAVNLANFLCDSRKISFDLVVQTMYETGRDLSKIYKETGQGGLAKLYP